MARTAIYPACETLWTLGLMAAAPLVVGGARPLYWCSRGGQRILVLAAHPDDETLGCGGAILRHKQAGDAVTVVVVTDGGEARGSGLPQNETIAVRASELETATTMLGVDRLEHWSLTEMRWTRDDATDRMLALLEAERPEIIYAHSLVDYHPEHRKVAAALAMALVQLDEPKPVVRCYEVTVPLGSLANLRLELSRVGRRKRAVLAAYTSQRDIANADRRRTKYNGALFGCRPAEAYWELSATEYARIMAQPPGPMYRALRERPLTDPLAYADRGRREGLRSSAGCKVQSAKLRVL